MSSPPPVLTDDDVGAAVRVLVRDAAVHVLEWHEEEVGWQVVSEVTDGVRRLRGWVRRDGQDLPWSLIVKTSRPVEDGDAQDHHGWQREWRAYTSGLLQPAGSVRPARLLQVTRPSPDRILLWLEDVPDTSPEVWALQQHVRFAGQLGAFNAAHPVGGSRPAWLWQDWLLSLRVHAPGVGALAAQAEVWNEPLVRLAFPVPCTAALQRVSAAFERWSAHLMALPQTLVHLDAGRFNVRVFSEGGQPSTVLLDWQALGTGPLGADLAMTHFLNVCRFYADPRAVEAIDAQGFEAYWAAVRGRGLGVGRSEVRFAYTAVSAMRAAIVVQLLLSRLVPPAVDLRLWAAWGHKRGWSEHEALRAWGQGMSALLALGAEADALAQDR
ncbi:hypothetical protein [Deinococcus sonorensis]|uniref:Aminoglycoside phosphotransferase domain-containing protein n=2 Tax=Deinococcus sonorensis TaxID=309891 RepID=A0AAU7U5R0_9DEIO